MNTDHLEILEKTQLPSDQARAILEVMESELTARDGALATKRDLQDVALAMKTDLREAVLAMRGDMEKSLLAFRNEMEKSLLAFRGEMKDSLHTLDLKITGVESRLTRWVFTCVFGLGTLILGFMYLGLTHLRP